MNILVRFKRSQNDDAAVIGKDRPTPLDYATQLAEELQLGYDNGDLAGTFQVVSVTTDDGTVTAINP